MRRQHLPAGKPMTRRAPVCTLVRAAPRHVIPAAALCTQSAWRSCKMDKALLSTSAIGSSHNEEIIIWLDRLNRRGSDEVL